MIREIRISILNIIYNIIQKIKSVTMANLLQINPYSNKFFDIAAENLLNAFSKQTPENIQIQFKYAVLNHPLYHLSQKQLKDIPPKQRARTEYLLERQANEFLNTLQLISSQSVINLNPIGKNICSVTSGFNQFEHKKIYHMRDLFIKLGIFNQYVNYKRVQPINRPFNIYQELSLHNYNFTFHVKHQSQIRLDLYLKDPVSMQLQGRYSYTAQENWVKAKKEPLCPQLDYLFSGQIFRFAINRQKQSKVPESDILEIANIIKSTRKAFDIRLKRQTIIRKAHHFQITISQIYNISDVQVCQDIAYFMTYSDAKAEFDRYIRKLFINFYSCMQREKHTLRFEIELEISKIWNQKYKDLLQSRKFQQVRNQLNTVMEELLAMYYADHTTKVKQQNWMNYLVPNQMEQARLENEFGGYMRERIYKQMERAMRPQMRK